MWGGTCTPSSSFSGRPNCGICTRLFLPLPIPEKTAGKSDPGPSPARGVAGGLLLFCDSLPLHNPPSDLHPVHSHRFSLTQPFSPIFAQQQRRSDSGSGGGRRGARRPAAGGGRLCQPFCAGLLGDGFHDAVATGAQNVCSAQSLYRYSVKKWRVVGENERIRGSMSIHRAAIEQRSTRRSSAPSRRHPAHIRPVAPPPVDPPSASQHSRRSSTPLATQKAGRRSPR